MSFLKVVKGFLFLTTFFYFSLISKSYADEYCKSDDPKEVLETKFDRIYFDEANYKEAFICSEFGASLNHEAFLGWVGYFYYNGVGTEINLEKAYKHFNIASNNGSGYASWYMGRLFEHGIPEMNLKINHEKAFSYLKLSYEQNYSYALYSLARAYYYGLGVGVDYEQSFNYLDLASENLNNFGKSLLAKHYLLGRGVKQNIEEGVRLLEENIDDGYFVSSETLNILFGKGYLDRENRKTKSTFFYQYEREKYIDFGYKGEEHVEFISQLSMENKHLEVISYSKKIIDQFRKSLNTINNPITEEVCYAINKILYHHDLLEDDLMDDKYLFNLVEFAYQNDCGGVTVSNYAWFLIWSEDYKDYKKAFEMLVNDIKNNGGSWSVGQVATLYNNGWGVKENKFLAYILYQYKVLNTYETLSNSTWEQDNANELKELLGMDELKKANIAVAEINKDFNEVFKYLYNDMFYSDERIIVKKIENEFSKQSDISEFQKDILTEKSNVEKKLSSQVEDKNPPEIIIDDDIKIEGLVANINLTVIDESNIAALYIDGTPIIIDTNNIGKIIVQQTVFVGSDDKQVKIEAYDKWGFSTVQSILLNKVVESLNINYGDYYALIIGNNDYDYLPKLKTAINDAKKISTILSSTYNFKEVSLLEDATRKEILVALYDLKKKLSFKDNLFIYYAGHGEIDRQINEGYWQPVDALPELPTEWIDNNTITSIIGTMKAKHILIIADSCYSGLLTRSGNNILQNTFDNREILLQRLSNKKSRLVFTSGGKEPVQDGGGGNHSIFAKSLINVLENNINEITLTEIAQEVIPYVITNSDQTPEFAPIHKSGHDGGDFIFVPKN